MSPEAEVAFILADPARTRQALRAWEDLDTPPKALFDSILRQLVATGYVPSFLGDDSMVDHIMKHGQVVRAIRTELVSVLP
jgi:hypothetical protein